MILLKECSLCYDEESKMFSISDNEDNDFVMKFPLNSKMKVAMYYAYLFQAKSKDSLQVDINGHLIGVDINE